MIDKSYKLSATNACDLVITFVGRWWWVSSQTHRRLTSFDRFKTVHS